MHFLNLHVCPVVYRKVKCNLFLYADDKCLVCQDNDINEIEKQLNKDFESICD